MKAWKRVALSELAESVDYGVTASATYQPVGPKFLRITDIQDGAVNWNKVPWCEPDIRSAADSRLRIGDIVFARTGATTGKSFLIRECPTGAVFASYLIRVRLGARADARYVSHFFQTPDYWGQVSRGARGVAQPGVNATTLKALEIPLPSLAEQRRIAAILDQAEAVRAKRREALKRVDTITQANFVELFGDLAKNSDRWPSEELGARLEFLTSGSRGWAEYYRDSGSLFLRIQNVGRNALLLGDVAYVDAPNTAEARRTRVQPGDVLLSITADLGRTAVIPEGIGEAYINQHLAILRVPTVDPLFLSAYLACPAGQRQVLARNRQAVKAGLNFDDIRSIRLPLPPLSLQRKFAASVKAVERLRTSQLASRAKLDALFASLQHRAFRGEL
jgi:type I restriction enzyme S subunit